MSAPVGAEAGKARPKPPKGYASWLEFALTYGYGDIMGFGRAELAELRARGLCIEIAEARTPHSLALQLSVSQDMIQALETDLEEAQGQAREASALIKDAEDVLLHVWRSNHGFTTRCDGCRAVEGIITRLKAARASAARIVEQSVKEKSNG